MKKGEPKLSPMEIQTFVAEYLQEGNYSAVARIHGKNPSTIAKAVERYRANNPEEYRKMYDDYLQKSEEAFVAKTTSVINKAISKISDKLEDADEYSIAQLSTTMGILYDKRQLSLGKSTSNSAVVIKMADELQDLAK